MPESCVAPPSVKSLALSDFAEHIALDLSISQSRPSRHRHRHRRHRRLRSCGCAGRCRCFAGLYVIIDSSALPVKFFVSLATMGQPFIFHRPWGALPFFSRLLLWWAPTSIALAILCHYAKERYERLWWFCCCRRDEDCCAFPPHVVTVPKSLVVSRPVLWCRDRF